MDGIGKKVRCLITLLWLVMSSFAYGRELRMLYMAQAGYQPSHIVQRARSFEQETGIAVHLSFVEYEDQYKLIVESAAKERADYDIILEDIIWTAEFAERRIIDPVPPELVQEVERGIVPEISSAFMYDDTLWAVPFLANFQLMYSNMELLQQAGYSEPPDTLEELVEIASKAKEQGVIEYPIFLPLRKQEALICVFVWLTGSFGGGLSNEDGEIDVDNAASRRALSFLVDMLNRGLLNPFSLQQEEVFAAEAFTWGDALFTMNWTFVTGLMREKHRPIYGAGRASLIPPARTVLEEGGRSSTVSGFQGLSVTRNSANKDAAWRFIRYLSSPDFQRKHLEEMSVWREVWGEERTFQKDPDISLKMEQIAGVRNRPIHPQYRKVSLHLQHWIYEALRGEVSPSAALERAREEIEGLSD